MNQRSENLPNLFIVGAAKAGTTSVYNYLNSHPDIFMSPIKEPNFFGSDIQWENFEPSYKKKTNFNAEHYFSQSRLAEKHIAFINSKANYLKLFERGTESKYRGEASTSYLYSKNAAKEIYDFNPSAKIIIILREPNDRTISHYLMDLSGEGQNEMNILEGLKKDYNSKPKGWGISHLYIELSLYYDQISRYLQVFDSKQVLILDYNNLKESKEDFLEKILKFLHLEDNPEIGTLDKTFNQTLVPKYKIIKKLLKIKKIIPASFSRLIKHNSSFLFNTTKDIIIPPEVNLYVSGLVEANWKKTLSLMDKVRDETY